MRELLMIAVGSALVNNVVLSHFLGLCPFLGVSKKMDTACMQVRYCPCRKSSFWLVII